MEASATLALVISNIHSAILKVTSKLEWAVGAVNDNTRRLNNLHDLTTVSSEDNRLAIEKLIAEVDSLKAENEGLRESMRGLIKLLNEKVNELNLSTLAREDEMKDDILFNFRRVSSLSKEVRLLNEKE